MKAVPLVSGGAENLTVSKNTEEPTLMPNEILIQVVYSTVSEMDIAKRYKIHHNSNNSEILGVEASGYISKIGNQCTSTLKVGDRVMVLLQSGGNADYVTVTETMVMLIPVTVDLSIAAALPYDWLLAYDLLHNIGKIKYKDNVLIHLASSSLGMAAIQMCSLVGAMCYVTADSEAKIAKLIDLGATVALNYKDTNVADFFLKSTKDCGMNVILDCVGGSFWQDNATLIATDGKWIIYNVIGGGQVNGDLLTTILNKSVTMYGTVFANRSMEYKSEIIRAFTKNIIPRVEKGRVQPVIDRIMPLSDIVRAHTIFETNQNIGKILLEIKRDGGKDKKGQFSYRLPDDNDLSMSLF